MQFLIKEDNSSCLEELNKTKVIGRKLVNLKNLCLEDFFKYFDYTRSFKQENDYPLSENDLELVRECKHSIRKRKSLFDAIFQVKEFLLKGKELNSFSKFETFLIYLVCWFIKSPYKAQYNKISRRFRIRDLDYIKNRKNPLFYLKQKPLDTLANNFYCKKLNDKYYELTISLPLTFEKCENVKFTPIEQNNLQNESQNSNEAIKMGNF